MDEEEMSDSDSNSMSDTEIDDFILPTLDAVPDIADDEDFAGIALAASSSQELEVDHELRDGAYQVMDGKLSMAEYEAVIDKKDIATSAARTLSPEVVGLVGQANMSFVRGEYEETLRLCKEAIRIAPGAAEPYRTMSEMYDELGEHDKGLQLGMIAAAMGTRDAENWVSLGDKAVDLDKPREALYCYSKAVRIKPDLIHIYLTMARLYDPEKEKKLIITTYQKLVQRAPVELGAEILEHAQKGAHLLHEEKDFAGALAIMETAFQRVPEHVRLDDVNLIVELYISLQMYQKSLETISRYCDVSIEAEDDLVADSSTSEVTSSGLRVISCFVNGEIPLQIRAKLTIILIYLKAFHLTDSIISPIIEDFEEEGDLMIDIIEAFMAVERYTDALKLLKLLVNSKHFSLPQVWLHYADCLRKLDRKEEAVSAYLVVMDQAPQLADARLVVSDLLNDLGRGDEAISALAQDPDSGFLDVGMLFERCLLLSGNPARAQEFLVAGRLLLSRHCARFRTKKEFYNFMRYSRGTHRQESKKYQEEDPQEPTYIEGKRMPTAEEEFDLFKSLCKTAFESKQYSLLERLTCSGLGSKVICKNAEKESEVFCLAALSAYFNKDSFAAHTFFKHLIANGYDNSRTWNAFNMILTQSEDVRHQKYIVRLLTRKPSHPALPIIFANNCFTSGSYKQALSEYLLQYKHQPTPLLALLTSATCLQLSFQKSAKGVNALVAQAMGFIAQYRELRGEECLQEVHYNLGRLNHQLCHLPVALYHYKQVLEIPAPCEMYDLKREAAYNISLIYQASKSYHLARDYIQKYIVV